jgi:hypothetical protein
MVRYGALAFAALLLLSGCVTGSGTDYAGLAKKLGPPTAGQSRIAVLTEKRSGLVSYCICDMTLDDADIGKVRTGTFIDADRPAGAHVLTADELLYAGQTRREIRIEAGRTYFFLIRSSKRHDAVNGLAFAGGLAGAAIGTVATAGDENPGPCGYFPVGRCDGRGRRSPSSSSRTDVRRSARYRDADR